MKFTCLYIPSNVPFSFLSCLDHNPDNYESALELINKSPCLFETGQWKFCQIYELENKHDFDSAIYTEFKKIFDRGVQYYICGPFSSWNPTEDTNEMYYDGSSSFRLRGEFIKCLEDFRNPARLFNFIIAENYNTQINPV